MTSTGTTALSSADAALLRDSARHFLHERHPLSRLRQDIDEARALDATQWRAAAALGWQGLLVPERQGGGGGSWADALVIAEECGNALYPYPVTTTMALASILAAAPADSAGAEVLHSIVDGSAGAAWAIAESGDAWTLPGATTASRTGEGATVSGEKWFVAAAGDFDVIAVTATAGGRPVLVLVAPGAPGVTIAASRTIDPTRRLSRVTLNAAAVDSRQVLRVDPHSLERAVDGATLLVAADAVGACRRLLAMTVDHAMHREAFGRRIAEYQAIKHRCADMSVWTETMAAAARAAAAALDSNDASSTRLVSAAKQLTGELGPRVAGEALQVHGGIGFTWEHDLHLFLRRVMADSTLFGDSAAHSERLVAALVAGVAP